MLFDCEMTPTTSPQQAPELRLAEEEFDMPEQMLFVDGDSYNPITVPGSGEEVMRARSHEEDMKNVADRLLGNSFSGELSHFRGQASSADAGPRHLAQSMDDGPVTPSSKQERKVTLYQTLSVHGVVR